MRAMLADARVEFLIDVRSSPFSRHQPDFSRERLDRLARGTSRYVFMGDLLGGRPADASCYTEGHVDYEKVKERDFFKRGIERLASAHAQGFCVCLLCSEGQPSKCHRAKLIGATLAQMGLVVTHLLPNGRERSQEAVMREVLGPQADLFGAKLMSRKAYR